MAAYNWILIDDVCSACGRRSVMRCQTHVASSFDGDDEGRFFDAEYRLGEKMRWWEPGHAHYEQWRYEGRIESVNCDPTVVEEACCSECLSCDTDLVVVVRFRELVPFEVEVSRSRLRD